MKNSNIIDLTAYFAHPQPADVPAPRFPALAAKFCNAMARALNVAATAAIALCVCACTLLFFTML